MSERIVLIDESILEEIAQSIRTKSNTNDKIIPKGFANKILNFSNDESIPEEDVTKYSELLMQLENLSPMFPAPLNPKEICNLKIYFGYPEPGTTPTIYYQNVNDEILSLSGESNTDFSLTVIKNRILVAKDVPYYTSSNLNLLLALPYFKIFSILGDCELAV